MGVLVGGGGGADEGLDKWLWLACLCSNTELILYADANSTFGIADALDQGCVAGSNGSLASSLEEIGAVEKLVQLHSGESGPSSSKGGLVRCPDPNGSRFSDEEREF